MKLLNSKGGRASHENLPGNNSILCRCCCRVSIAATKYSDQKQAGEDLPVENQSAAER